ncbi:MAG: folate family ECF transporter S component [Clostridiales bacterium]|nr:folate family ECF transporter S component [Clostridiales bacterium]
MLNSNKDLKAYGGIRMFVSLKVLLVSAMFIALSIVLGKQLSFTMGPLRFSFENLTILMAGIMFGPIIGTLVGAAADIIGCIIVGYSINPIITVGAASIGLISGLVSFYCFADKPKLRILAAVGLAHLVGSVIIKSIGLYVYYRHPISLILLRIPTYIIIGSIEGYLIYVLMTNKAFSRQLQKIRNN